MKKYIFFFTIALLLYSLHFYTAKHGIYGDGNGYYALTHTVFFQSKLNFEPVYGYLSSFHGSSYIFSRIFWDSQITDTGVINTPWLIGTAFFWLPSFFFIQLLSKVGFQIGIFSWLYEYGCGVTGIVLMLMGLGFIEITLRKSYNYKVSSLVSTLLFAGSQVFYYASFEPALSHQASFFLISFILYLIHLKNGSSRTIVLLGLSLGLLAITRIAEVALVILPICLYWIAYIKKHKRKSLVGILLFIIFICLGLVPQLLLQKTMYGSYLYNPYFGAEKGVFHTIFFSSLYSHLFAAGGGFLVWSPIMALAIIGFIIRVLKRRQSPNLYIYSCSLSLLTYYLLIASWEYVPPAGFGNRFFLSVIPLLALGLAQFILRFSRYIKIIFILTILWNILLLGQFFLDPERMVERKGLTLINLIVGQVETPIKRTGNLLFLIQ